MRSLLIRNKRIWFQVLPEKGDAVFADMYFGEWHRVYFVRTGDETVEELRWYDVRWVVASRCFPHGFYKETCC